MPYKGTTVQEQMAKILNDYTADAIEEADKAIKSTADDAADKLQNESPKGKTGDYAKGWAVKQLEKGRRSGIFSKTGVYIDYNKTDWHLTHLLENGHIIRNAKGTYGRTRPNPHIAPVEDWAADEVTSAIKRKLST